MAYGFRDNILRVNLTTREITVEHPGEAFFRKYLGGKTLAGYYLNKEVSGECDALSPENKVIVSASVITGAPIPGSSRFSVCAKSPQTDGFGSSEAGGFFGPELKFAGFDAVIIEGKADKPCYLWIKDGEVEIRDAAHLWGRATGEVQEAIREEHGDKRIRVLQTGPGGENLVRFAALTNELKHWNGRCGMGAVFGSKNLRAIAVRGTQKIEMKNQPDVLAFTKWFAEASKKAEGVQEFGAAGTSSLVTILDSMGILPTRNFQSGSFEDAAKICGSRINEELLIKRESCYACPVRCKRVVEYISDDAAQNIDPAYGGPEYETLGAIGSNCGVSSMIDVCKGNELIGKYGLDSIATGVTISFAMECWEKGLITAEDTGGIDYSWGSKDFLKIIESIGERKGFGDVLAEGTYRASQKIGKGSEKYAMHAKKMEFAAHEPRGKWNVGLGYAVSPQGGDHVVVEHDHCMMGEPNMDPDYLGAGDIYPMMKWGIREPIDPIGLSHKKVVMFVMLQKMWAVCDTLDLCIFLTEPSRRLTSMEHITKFVNDICGWDMYLDELIQIGEKATVLGRLFNAKCGFGAENETLPDRMFEPLQGGALEGMKMDRAEFEEAKKIYYDITGMDRDGKPLYGKVCALGLEELWFE